MLNHRLAALAGRCRCAGCSIGGRPLCDACATRLRRPSSSTSIPPVARVVAPWAYEGAARNLVLGLKLGGMRPFAEPLVAAMHREICRSGLFGSVVTWVPARRRDNLKRGFDHAEVLARGLAGSLGLPARPSLARTSDRPDQTSLGGAARRVNLEGAFRARACRGGIVLVDDLITTGATARCCARALLDAGAERVESVVACRA